MKTRKGRVEGKIALVTGAADGIGLAIAKLLSEEGANVIIADIHQDKGEKVAKDIGGTFRTMNVADEASWKGLTQWIKKEFGRLDILVNNAGIAGKGEQDPEHASFDDWKTIHAVNLDSVFLGCKYSIPLMKESGGSIVNMSARSGVVGVPFGAAYASSKAAIRNHTKSVALYCAAKGYPIRANSVHPASILTDMWKSILGSGEEGRKNLERISSEIPMKRFGTPEEVAYAVLYLASDESSYTTGSELTIDGGILAGTASSPDTHQNK